MKFGKISIRKFFIFTTIICLVLTVVVPNSLPLLSAGAMSVSALFALSALRLNAPMRRLFGLYFLTVVVTFAYIVVGQLNGATFEALIQVSLVYIVSPFLWIIIANGIFRSIELERFYKILGILTLLACATVAIYFYGFLNFGPEFVSFFKEEGANLNLADGYSGATLHVYGSLIFLTAGFISSPELVRNFIFRIVLFACLFASAITSGRSALLLSVIVGMICGFILTPRTLRESDTKIARSNNLLKYAAIVTVGIILVVYLINSYTNINLRFIYGLFFEKIADFGGDARTEQLASLYQGTLDSSGLGVGHGIGTDYVRNYRYPWRYELIWMATIYRVGIVGAVIYALPFFMYILTVIKIVVKGKLPREQKFLFSAFIASFVASNTNPYIEGFTFQWMFIIPMVGLFVTLPVSAKRKCAQSGMISITTAAGE